MSDFALVLDGVSKRYGKREALSGLSLSVPRGSVCGLVGPNGAGKTTAMSIAAGFLLPDEGGVNLLGMGPFDPEKHRGRVGILPQDADLPPASTPFQLLLVWARLQGLGGGQALLAVQNALRAVKLWDRAHSRTGTLSHGMRRRVTVASALLGDPELVMLDEPTSGLDPAQAVALREVIARERGRRTVLVSSHNLLEMEALCDHVVFIDGGRCVGQGAMTRITLRDREVRIRLAPPLPPGRSQAVVLTLTPEDPRSLEEATSQLLSELLSEGALIAEVRQGETLENRYLAGAVRGD